MIRLNWGMYSIKHIGERVMLMESTSALVELAFRQGAHRIYAECDSLNNASWKLLEKLGFQRETFFQKNIFFWKDEKGMPIWKDTYVYAKLKEGQHSLPSKQ